MNNYNVRTIPKKVKSNSGTTKAGPIDPQPTKTCKHLHLVPYEIRYGKLIKISGSGKDAVWDWDWSAAIMGASKSIVSTYYCPECFAFIHMPLPTKD